MIGTKLTETAKNKISKALRGNKNASGYKHTDAAKSKMIKFKDGHIPWNKGLTSKNSDGVKRISISRKNNLTIYKLQTPLNKIFEFKGKNMLQEYIRIINDNFENKRNSKINIRVLIKNKESKGYKLL